MDKVKNRFTKIGRTFSTSSHFDPSTPNPIKKRSRSISEILESDHAPSSGHTGPYLLTYHGYMCVEDPRSSKDVVHSLRAVRGSHFNDKLVSVTHSSGTLRVAEGTGEGILVCPLHSIGLVCHDAGKGGHGDCFAISFSTGHYAKQCHAFQAKSSQEASQVVQAVQKSVKSASKEKKVSKKMPSESRSSQSKGATSEGSKVRRPMQFMEDEDEVVEHKSIAGFGGRRESKKTIPALHLLNDANLSSSSPALQGPSQAAPPSDSTPSSTLQAAGPLVSGVGKDHRRKVQRKQGGVRGSGGPMEEFTQQDKEDQLVSAVDRIQENNHFLREKARCILKPTNNFEESLVAMASGNGDLLGSYVSPGNVNVQDSGGNTLLHYAVALGQLHTVRMLCANNASLEAAGWNDCKPIHRAVAEGHTHILQTLLKQGAEVNSMDLMRRTPLHFSSTHLEFMECTYSLLEFGAHVMDSDLLGLRPFDLNPELKEIVNRLVTSACETFVSAPLLNGGKDPSPQPGTPTSRGSPSLSSLDDLDGDELKRLVESVTCRAESLASRAHAHRKHSQKAMSHPHSRSHGNLLDLQEGDEDSALRKERLKFPSDFAIDSAHRMLINRVEALQALRTLIRSSRAVKKRGVAREGGVARERGDLESSLSEPELYQEEVSIPARPSSSAAILQDSRVASLLEGGSARFTGDSGSSTGTLKDDAEDESFQQLSRAFDMLQEDLKRDSFTKSQDELQGEEFTGISERLREKPGHLSADSTPLMAHRSKQETGAIFDDLISQMEDVTRIICPRDNLQQGEGVANSQQQQQQQQYQNGIEPIQNGMEPAVVVPDSGMELESGGGSDRLSVMKRRVQSNDAPKGVVRPSSSTSNNRGEGEGDDAHPPRAASVETEMVFATLPKKKKRGRKWSGIRRIGSPLFRNRRKSFNNATPTSGSNHTPSPKVHVSVTQPSPSTPLPPTTSRLAMESHSPVSSSKPRPHPSARREVVTLVEKLVKDEKKVGRGVARRRGSSRDECLNALRMMTTLSSNQESLASLISYICLPKSVTKLIEISQDPCTSEQVLGLISALVGNLYQSAGSEGKKTALGSGVLDLTIKLLQSRDPIPSTCLSQLNQLLVSEDDNDYLRTIIRIPTAPLLQYLEGCGQEEGEEAGHDSGYENSSSHSRKDTAETRYSSDTMSTATDEGVAGMGGASGGGGVGNYLGLPPVASRHSGGRSSSETSNTSSSAQNNPVLSPPSPHTPSSPHPPELDPKRIVLKMLAVSSTHSKMQLSLSTQRAVSLLGNCSSDPSHQNITNTLITLANIAQNVGSHQLFHQLGVVKKLQSLSCKGPRPRYHASRALVYMGHLDLVQDFDLFYPDSTEYESDVVMYSADADGHTYARGAIIERCVDLLTSNPTQLWGGFSLVGGPHASKKDASGPSLQASKDQVYQFFLTMYKSFVHPLILMRLLLHRLCSQDPLNLFDWSGNPVSMPSASQQQPVSIPPTQASVLNLIGRWLELYGDDFAEYPFLRQELEKVISRLKLVRGPYIPHTHRLRSLFQDMERPKAEQQDRAAKKESRPPHHDNLYKLCQQMVTGGHLPITLEQAIFLASLQLHLDDLAGNSLGVSSNPGTPVRSKTGTSRLKSVFPPGFSKSKSIMKRVKARRSEFETLSERNAKHLYIERCQTNPGYDCSFFTVRVPSSARFKRGPIAKQLMGVNSKRIVFLDEKSKELIASHSLQSVLRITREMSDPCILLIDLHGDAAGFKIQLDSAPIAKEVANILQERREVEGIVDESNLRWSDSVPSLFTMSTDQDTADTDSSDSTLDHTPTDRGATPPSHMLSYDLLKNPSPDGMLAAATATPNGHMETMLTHKSDTLRAFSHDDSLVADLNDHFVLSEKEKMLFCDCPPDPEIPPEININSIVLVEILSCPLEIARQMTLIAHARFGELTSTELLHKVNLLPKTSSHQDHTGNQRDSIASTSTLRSSMMEPDLQETAVEKLAYRFNQVGNWVAHSILQFEYLEERAEVIQQFIAIAKHCFELGNFSSMMSIVVAGLGSAPVRRLHSSWAQVPKADMETFKAMDTLLDSRGNYKNYREKLASTEVPAVPYVGVFLKDLTFLCDGNPDYLRGGLINMHKRRQVYRLLEEIHHYQKFDYKLHCVPELQSYLLSHKLAGEDDLHSTSHTVEPRIRRTHSNSSTKSLSSIQTRSFFKGLTRSGSSSGSYLHRTSSSALN